MADVLLSMALAVLVLLFPLAAAAGIWVLLVAPALLARGAGRAARWRPRVHISRYVNYEQLPQREESGWKTC